MRDCSGYVNLLSSHWGGLTGLFRPFCLSSVARVLAPAAPCEYRPSRSEHVNRAWSGLAARVAGRAEGSFYSRVRARAWAQACAATLGVWACGRAWWAARGPGVVDVSVGAADQVGRPRLRASRPGEAVGSSCSGDRKPNRTPRPARVGPIRRYPAQFCNSFEGGDKLLHLFWALSRKYRNFRESPGFIDCAKPFSSANLP